MRIPSQTNTHANWPWADRGQRGSWPSEIWVHGERRRALTDCYFPSSLQASTEHRGANEGLVGPLVDELPTRLRVKSAAASNGEPTGKLGTALGPELEDKALWARSHVGLGAHPVLDISPDKALCI